MRTVAIIGGGIAGLSAAYYLEQARARRNNAEAGAGLDLEWTLFEKSHRFGGVILTECRDGFVLEGGPDSFLTAKPEAAQLCCELGLGDQLVGSNDAERKTHILLKGRLVEIPHGLEFMVPTRVWSMARTSLFSLPAKIGMLLEMMRPRRSSGRHAEDDESVASFVRRHFGQEMVDRVAEPLLAGVYGGDAERLSVQAVLARFVEMERKHGSLVRAALAARRKIKTTRTEEGPASQEDAAHPLFTSLESGMQQLVDALLSVLPASSLCASQDDLTLRRYNDTWLVTTRQQGSRQFDDVLLALPAPAAGELLMDLQPDLAAMLTGIRYTSSAAVILAFDRANLPPGFGFLVPQSEAPRSEGGGAGVKMLACTFVHNKFPHRAPESSALLRCFFSSARLRNVLSHSDAGLVDLAQRELQQIVGLTATPRFARVFRCECALPQYEVGHLERVSKMEEKLKKLPGIRLIGNSFYGVGIPDCIKSARQAVEAITAESAQQSAFSIQPPHVHPSPESLSGKAKKSAG